MFIVWKLCPFISPNWKILKLYNCYINWNMFIGREFCHFIAPKGRILKQYNRYIIWNMFLVSELCHFVTFKLGHFEAIQYFKRKPLSSINSITQPGTLTANTDTLMASIGHLTFMSSATLSQPLYDMLRVSTSTLLSLSQSQGLYNQYPGLYILQALSSWHVLVQLTSTLYHHLLTTSTHGFYNIPYSWLLLTILRPLPELSWSPHS